MKASKGLTNSSNPQEMNDLYETFWQLWDEGDVDELQEFSRRIDMLAQAHGTQQLL